MMKTTLTAQQVKKTVTHASSKDRNLSSLEKEDQILYSTVRILKVLKDAPCARLKKKNLKCCSKSTRG
jgi:hypothetical protein